MNSNRTKPRKAFLIFAIIFFIVSILLFLAGFITFNNSASEKNTTEIDVTITSIDSYSNACKIRTVEYGDGLIIVLLTNDELHLINQLSTGDVIQIRLLNEEYNNRENYNVLEIVSLKSRDSIIRTIEQYNLRYYKARIPIRIGASVFGAILVLLAIYFFLLFFNINIFKLKNKKTWVIN